MEYQIIGNLTGNLVICKFEPIIPPGEPFCSVRVVMSAVTMLSRSPLSKSTPTLNGRWRAQTVPTAVAAAFVNRPVAEDKALPQRRPPFVNAAAAIAAIAAVSAPGTSIQSWVHVFEIKEEGEAAIPPMLTPNEI